MNDRIPIHFLPDMQIYSPCVRIIMGFSQGLGYGILGLIAAFVILAMVGVDASTGIVGSCCAGFLFSGIGFSMPSQPQTVVVYK